MYRFVPEDLRWVETLHFGHTHFCFFLFGYLALFNEKYIQNQKIALKTILFEGHCYPLFLKEALCLVFIITFKDGGRRLDGGPLPTPPPKAGPKEDRGEDYGGWTVLLLPPLGGGGDLP